MTAEATRDVAVRRFAAVTLVLPGLLTLIGVVLQLASLPVLPDSIAVNWGADGAASGFAPAWVMMAGTAVIGYGIPLLVGLSALPGLRRGDRGPTFRFMGSSAAAMSVLIVVMLTWSVLMQRGLTEASQAPSIAGPMIAASVLAILAGLGAWRYQPVRSVSRTPAPPVEALDLGAAEIALWVRTASLARPGLVVIVGGGAVALVTTILSWMISSGDAVRWMLLATTLVLLGAAATTAAFVVRADRRGLTVTSAVGFPRFHVAIDEIESAGVIDVNPMGEFGGWGLRSAPGRLGVILRAGEALRVTRRDGRQLVVTVGDAATAASLLTAYARRRHGAA